MKYLPRKPSRLIRIALKDLAARERDPKYRIEMGTWHQAPNSYQPSCRVCFAGAVMGRLGIKSNKFAVPSDFAEPIRDKFYALNAFRRGDIYSGFDYMGIPLPKGVPHSIDVADYSLDRNQFFDDMNCLADLLEKSGV